MKVRSVAIVLACVLLATGAWAQYIGGISPRAAAMGGAGIGVADDAAAWYQNPAGLAALSVPCREGAEYGTQALFSYANSDGDDYFELSVSGWNPSQRFGYGGGYATFDTGHSSIDLAQYYYSDGSRVNIFGVGFGAAFSNLPLSAGLSLVSINGGGEYYYTEQIGLGGLDTNMLNAGLMYRVPQGADRDPIRLGVTASDVTNTTEFGPIWSAGLGWKPTKNLLVAVDAADLSDEIGDSVLVSGGIEYCLNDGGRQWFGRAGLMDTGDDHWLTLGAGFHGQNWHVDFAWINSDPSSTWTAGLSCDM